MVPSILQSPWRPSPVLAVQSNSVLNGTNHPNRYDKFYECVNDLLLNCLSLAVFNTVTIGAWGLLKRKLLFSSVVQVNMLGFITSGVYLSVVEGYNYSYGINMRKIYDLPIQKIYSLGVTLILSPLIAFKYQKNFSSHQCSIMKLIFFSIIDCVTLPLIQYA